MIAESTILDLRRYNGAITVTNPATGNHRTFRIHTVRTGGLKGSRVVGLLIGSNNESDYLSFGFVNEEGRIILWKKHRGTDYEKFSKILNYPDQYTERFGLQYQFATTCRKCNRELTDPESIRTGLGPVCRGSVDV